jgi:hemerythrin-like metal-binding protein
LISVNVKIAGIAMMNVRGSAPDIAGCTDNTNLREFTMTDFDNLSSSNLGRSDLERAMCIGVDEVDRIHAELAGLIERLDEMPLALTSSESIASLLWDLRQVLTAEFETEEKLMRSSGIAVEQIEDHVLEHNMLLTLVIDASIGSMSRNPTTARQLYQTIRNHVLAHTMKHDAELGQ